VYAVVPESEPRSGRVAVTVWQRTGTNRLVGTDHEVAVSGIEALVAAIVAEPADTLTTAVREAPPELLLCTHGKRDVCCGGMGTVLHREVSARWDGVRVRRCSHTGGHRYAPTGLTFPDGRAWAFLDDTVLDRIVRREGDVLALRNHQRGCSALDPWAQVVERAVFEHLGWRWLDCNLDDVVIDEAADHAEVTLVWTGPEGVQGRAVGEVEAARWLPVPECGEPITSELKTSPEFRLRSVALTQAF
jgi:hypothetical protein